MMLPGMIAGWMQELLGYQYFFLWIMVCCAATFGVTALLKIDPEFGKNRPNKQLQYTPTNKKNVTGNSIISSDVFSYSWR